MTFNRKGPVKRKPKDHAAITNELACCLSWAVGYVAAGCAMDREKKGDNAAVNAVYEWMERAEAALDLLDDH